MRLLAIETSTAEASIAACAAEQDRLELLREQTLPRPQRTAQALAPALDELLKAVGWAPAEVQLAAVATGPGSFTGLRIGVTAAKTLAYATGAQIIGVSTWDALAERVPIDSPDTALWTLIDAQRGELFAAAYRPDDAGAWQAKGTGHVYTQAEWLAALRAGDRVSGPGITLVADRLPAEVSRVEKRLWQPTAAAVASVAWRRYRAGQRDDPFRLLPQYHRLSAAEEKRLARKQ